jgi:hypothetical protein
MQISSIKCGAPHLMLNVALQFMWRSTPCLGLQLVVDLGIDVNRVERDMAEPGSDGVDVDTSA